MTNKCRNSLLLSPIASTCLISGSSLDTTSNMTDMSILRTGNLPSGRRSPAHRSSAEAEAEGLAPTKRLLPTPCWPGAALLCIMKAAAAPLQASWPTACGKHLWNGPAAKHDTQAVQETVLKPAPESWQHFPEISCKLLEVGTACAL